VCLNVQASAQYTKNPKELSFLKRNFFSHYRLGSFHGKTPSFNAVKANGTEIKSSVFMVSIINVGYNARINILDFNEQSSLSFSTPIDFSIGLGISTPDNGVKTGFATLSGASYLDFNYGFHSTYNNVQTKGLTAGIGIRTFLSPLVGYAATLESDRYKYQTLSYGPAVRFSYKKDHAAESNVILTLETGIPSSFVEKGERYISNVYINFSVGTAINY
jgi:hypothetical protein